MATTTFSGPVVSQNGFSSGTSSSPVAITTASNEVSFYATTSASSGDTRLIYSKLTFTSTGSGETVRAFSVVTAANAATAGTINGAHISLEVDGTGSISGAGNALRATLGGTQTTQTGTLGVIQLDTNYTGSVTTPSNSSFIRVTDSGSATGKINNLLSIASGPAATLVSTGAATPSGTIKKIKIDISGTTYYVLAATVWS
jgi:hypothetical protein